MLGAFLEVSRRTGWFEFASLFVDMISDIAKSYGIYGQPIPNSVLRDSSYSQYKKQPYIAEKYNSVAGAPVPPSQNCAHIQTSQVTNKEPSDLYSACIDVATIVQCYYISS